MDFAQTHLTFPNMPWQILLRVELSCREPQIRILGFGGAKIKLVPLGPPGSLLGDVEFKTARRSSDSPRRRFR